MGNCLKICAMRQEMEKTQVAQDQKDGSGVRTEVKMVLTRRELEWLMVKLKEEGGRGRKLEDVLVEMNKERREKERGRDNYDQGCWSPSLESIMEVPHEEAHV